MTGFDLNSDCRKDIREIKLCMQEQGIAIAKLQVKLDMSTRVSAGAITLISVLFPVGVWIFSYWR